MKSQGETSQAGVARASLTPYWGVELTGWGYYIERTWLDVRDPLYATALVVENAEQALAIVSLDLMIISEGFTRQVREMVAAATDIPATNILLTCTHTHNAPASGGLLGVGEVDPFYEDWAARQTATAVIQAWRIREVARFSGATTHVTDLTFNRTRPVGPIDPTLTALRVDRADGSPLAVLVGFQAHPTVSTVLHPRSVSRDVPGEICDHIERALPGCHALSIQGACGDVNFHREFSTRERAGEPAQRVASAALAALDQREELDASLMTTDFKIMQLPTRRWRLEEINADRAEAEQRLRDHDLTGWKDSIGRVMTNRPLEMVDRHGGDEWKAVAAMCRFNMEWTDRMLMDLEVREEWLKTEIQTLRIGDFAVISSAAEFFSTLAMEIRARVDFPHLMFACYANGRIGYLPDAYDVAQKSYAAYQSPKYCNQFPFTAESGQVAIQEMSALLNGLR